MVFLSYHFYCFCNRRCVLMIDEFMAIKIWFQSSLAPLILAGSTGLHDNIQVDGYS